MQTTLLCFGQCTENSSSWMVFLMVQEPSVLYRVRSYSLLQFLNFVVYKNPTQDQRIMSFVTDFEELTLKITQEYCGSILAKRCGTSRIL